MDRGADQHRHFDAGVPGDGDVHLRGLQHFCEGRIGLGHRPDKACLDHDRESALDAGRHVARQIIGIAGGNPISNTRSRLRDGLGVCGHRVEGGVQAFYARGRAGVVIEGDRRSRLEHVDRSGGKPVRLRLLGDDSLQMDRCQKQNRRGKNRGGYVSHGTARDHRRRSTIIRLIDAMALAGLRCFGQVFVQFMIV